MIYGGVEKLNLICSLSKDISEFLAGECMFGVCDTQKMIAYYPSNEVDIRAEIGQIVPRDSPFWEAMRNRKPIVTVVPKEVWGVAFRSTSMPILDEFGKAVGCIGIGISINRESQLSETYKDFSELLVKIINQTGIVSTSTDKISSDMSKFTEIAKETTKNAEQINSLLENINTIAETTDILAINASIEAARSGSSGRGFAVIASEIKSLSADTRKLTAGVNQMLVLLSKNIELLATLSSENNKLIESQKKTLNEVDKTVGAMQRTANDYSKLLS